MADDIQHDGDLPDPQAAASDDTWKPVDPTPTATPPMPTWVKVAGLGAIALLVAAAILIGILLGRGARPTETPSPSPTPTPSPSVNFEPPIQVGTFVASEATESQGPAPENQRIARANYFDGTDRVILAMTWPVGDLGRYLADAGVEGISEQAGTPGVQCGTSVDTNRAACGLMSGDTALLLLSVTDFPATKLAPLLQEFESAVAR